MTTESSSFSLIWAIQAVKAGGAVVKIPTNALNSNTSCMNGVYCCLFAHFVSLNLTEIVLIIIIYLDFPPCDWKVAPVKIKQNVYKIIERIYYIVFQKQNRSNSKGRRIKLELV